MKRLKRDNICDLEGFDIVEGSDGIPLTLGTTFAVRVPGKITAVRMYTGRQNGVYGRTMGCGQRSILQVHLIGRLSQAQRVGGYLNFSPVEIEADKDYMVSVRNNSSSLFIRMVLGYFESIDSFDSVFNLENSYVHIQATNLFPVEEIITYPMFLRDVVVARS